MPYISIETSQAVDDAIKPSLLKKASAMIAKLLGKPETYVMISIKDASGMVFGGSAEPAAFVEVKSIGLPGEKCTEYTKAISEFIKEELQIPYDRVFIDFKDLDRSLFAWNGKTFA